MFDLKCKALLLLLVLAAVSMISAPAMAEEAGADSSAFEQKNSSDATTLSIFGALIGAGIIVFGAAFGISKIASSATDAIARQPEAGARIFTSMLLAGALIEGVSFFGLIVCFMAIMWLT